MLAILKKYSIIYNLEVWIANNTNSNNAIITIIMKKIDSSIKDITLYRSRYFKYIINLAIKAFLFSKDSKVFKAIAKLINNLTLMDFLIMRET